MMKKFSFLFLLLALFACQSSDQLCECVEAGNEVNEISASLFERPHTQEAKDSLDAAIERRDSVCKQFEDLADGELQKRAKNCSSLQFETEEK